NGRWLPPDEAFAMPAEACVGMAGDEIAYVMLPRRALTSISFEQLPMLLEVWQHTLPTRPAGGRLIQYLWDLVSCNAAEICRDFGWLRPIGESSDKKSLAVLGPLGNLWVAASAHIEPMVVI